MKKYFQSQDEGGALEQSMGAMEPSLGNIKTFHKEELQGIGSDLKELKTDIKAFDERLMKREGKLNRLDATVEKFQVDIGHVKQKVLGPGKKIDGVVRSVKNPEGDMDDIGKNVS